MCLYFSTSAPCCILAQSFGKLTHSLLVPNGLFVLLLFSGFNSLYRRTFLLQCKKVSCLIALCHMKHIKTDKRYQVTRAKERSDVLPDTIPPALTLHPSLFRRGMAVLVRTPQFTMSFNQMRLKSCIVV